MNIKCIGCYDLLREEVLVGGMPLVVYICPRFFPYNTTIEGLIRPGKGIIEAVKLCTESIEGHCIICSKPALISYREPKIVFICLEHGRAWGKWLGEHPERRAHLAPRGRSVKANWIEVFREFVEDMRKEAEGQP